MIHAVSSGLDKPVLAQLEVEVLQPHRTPYSVCVCVRPFVCVGVVQNRIDELKHLD